MWCSTHFCHTMKIQQLISIQIAFQKFWPTFEFYSEGPQLFWVVREKKMVWSHQINKIQPAAQLKLFVVVHVQSLYHTMTNCLYYDSRKIVIFNATVFNAGLSRTTYCQISTRPLTPRCIGLVSNFRICNYPCCSIGIKVSYDITV